MPYQPDWKMCGQCKVLFFDGHADGNKGDCSGSPAGQRGHREDRWSFDLPYNVGPVENGQHNWRNCWKCQAMYYDGHADGNKGHCPSGGAHDGHGGDPATYNFVLQHDITDEHRNVRNWRNCWKCQAMCYDGDADKGRCAAGGTHECHADVAYNFVLWKPAKLN